MSRAVIRWCSLAATLVLLVAAWLVVALPTTEAATMTTPAPTTGGTTPNTSPFPPSTPTGLEAVSVTSTSVTLRWTASRPGCCPVEGYTVTYARAFNDILWLQTLGNVTTVTITANIQPASQYSFRVSARDGLGHVSGSSDPLTVVTPRTDTGPDTTPPSAPTDLRAQAVTGASATLAWSPATDNVAVTGYEVYKFDGVFVSTLIATVTGTEYTVPLTATRNLFYVRARDAAGNVSIATGLLNVTGTTTSSPGSPSVPALSCRVTPALTMWPGGFVLGLTITNTGTTPITDWTLTFSFGGDQRIIGAWSVTFSQSGPAVMLGPAAWNRVIPPGGSTSVGMQGTWTGSSVAPTAYFLNGVRCVT
jgi:hypothetical protein